MHHPTVEIYERLGAGYSDIRPAPDRVEVQRFLAGIPSGGRVLDLGCGPGRHLGLLGPGSVGADAAWSMVSAARVAHPGHPVVRCDLSHLPFAAASFAGVWASRAHQHIPATDLPLALAELHRVLEPGGRLELVMFTRRGLENCEHGTSQEVSTTGSGDDLPGRLFTWWDPDRLTELVTHAAFDVETRTVGTPDRTGVARVSISATWRLALPDHVGAGMVLLCCGINPSVHAAEAGVGYVTRSNRFWPALALAGLTQIDRDPRLLLRTDRIGMTDLVKRPTPRAEDVDRVEYRSSLERLERLCRWLEPAALVVVTLGGWRIASGDPRAQVGWQPRRIGRTPVYVMPSTSGLNARVPLDELAHHLETAASPP